MADQGQAPVPANPRGRGQQQGTQSATQGAQQPAQQAQIQPLPGYNSVEDSVMAIFNKEHELAGTPEGLRYVERWRSAKRGTLEQYDKYTRELDAKRAASQQPAS